MNLAHLRRIAGELGVPVQFGGGLRTLPASTRRARGPAPPAVILGTAAFTDPDFLDDVPTRFAPSASSSVDVRGGQVATQGWRRTQTEATPSMLKRLQQRGVRQFVYTNVDRDGMLEGPDCGRGPARRRARGRAPDLSGGIGTLADLRSWRPCARARPAPSTA